MKMTRIIKAIKLKMTHRIKLNKLMMTHRVKVNQMIKIAASMALILSVLASSCPAAMAETPPSVSAEAAYLNKNGILLGSGGDLRLEDDFTVEQLLTVLARLAGKEEEAKRYPVINNFKDVPADRWSAPYTAWAKATGVSAGKPDGTIGYAEKVTAQRLAAFLLRTMGYTDVPYSDVIKRAAELGFMQASQTAGNSLQRGAVAKIVHDAMQAKTQGGSSLAVTLGLDASQLTDSQETVSFEGTYVNSKIYHIDLDVSKLPAGMPKDVKLGYGGIAREFLSPDMTAAQIDTGIYYIHNENRLTMGDMNRGNGGVYPLSLVILYSPSTDKAWYHLFTEKMAEGTITCTMRMIDFAARNKANEAVLAAYEAMRDDGHAASIDSKGRLAFDSAKWVETPVRFMGLPSSSKTDAPKLDQIMVWLPHYLKTTISAGDPFRDLGGTQPYSLSDQDWIYYISATNEIVGYTQVTAQDIANYHGSFSMPDGIVMEQGAIFGYATDGTQLGVPDTHSFALYAVPDKAMKYAYVVARDYDEAQSLALIAASEQNRPMPSDATPIMEAVPYYLSRSSLPEGRGFQARFYDSDKKLVAIEALTQKQMSEVAVDIVTAKLPAPGDLFCGLDQTGINKEYLAMNIKVRVALDGQDVGTVPINPLSWVGIGLHGGTIDVLSGSIIEHPYVSVSGLYGYGGRLKYTLVMPKGEEFPLN